MAKEVSGSENSSLLQAAKAFAAALRAAANSGTESLPEWETLQRAAKDTATKAVVQAVLLTLRPRRKRGTRPKEFVL